MGCGSSKTVHVNADVKEAGQVKHVHHTHDTTLRPTKWSVVNDGNGKDNDICVSVEEGESKTPFNTINSQNYRKFAIGDTVHVRGYVGTVKFIGSTELGEAEWIGIEMERELEQGNDGSYEGIQYFLCASKCGVFARPSAVFPYPPSEDEREAMGTISPATIVYIQTRMRRVLTRIRRRKLQLRTEIERTIDTHVRNAKEAEVETIESLSRFLTEPFESLKNKAFAVYRWVTTNVLFDVEGYFNSNAKKSTDAESVLKNRVTSSEGYANLFEQLCRVSNVPARTVNGFAKGYGYVMRQKIPEPNHTWNVIRVNGGKWFVCDASWGAGKIGEDMMFHRDPNVHHFMIPLDEAITNHYPVEEKWQLLETPISKEAFERLAVPSGFLRLMNVGLCSHRESMYTAAESDVIEITFSAPDSRILQGILRTCDDKEKPTPRNMVLVESRRREKVKLTAQFPSAGEFFLDVNVLVDAKWEHGVRYCIYSTAGVGENRGGYPTVSQHFHSLGFQLGSPLKNIETKDGKACVSLTCSKKRFCSVTGKLARVFSDGSIETEQGNLCFGEKKDSAFRLKVHLPAKGEYKLSIYGKYYDRSKSEEYLCTYFVTSYKGMTPMPGFPTISERFCLWGLALKSHKENILSENGRSIITVQNPKGIALTAHLRLGDEDLLGMCSVEPTENESESTIHVHAPKAGVFTVNVFGRRAPQESKAEFMCSYTIKALKGVSDCPGFPQISECFRKWNVEFVDHQQNILSENGRVSLKLKTPVSVLIQATLHQGENSLPHELCFTEKEGSVSKISVHLPQPGLYKLNVFGREGPASKGEFLCSFNVLANCGLGENSGFPRVSDEFRAWGLRLESHRENITVYDGSVAVTFINPNGINVFARLSSAENEERLEKSCLTTERAEEREVIFCRLPKRGRYKLDAFGKNTEGEKKVLLCSYAICY